MSLYDLTSRPGSDASFTLVVLHHAGGSARGYLPWAGHLPSDWRLLGVDLPGGCPPRPDRCAVRSRRPSTICTPCCGPNCAAPTPSSATAWAPCSVTSWSASLRRLRTRRPGSPCPRAPRPTGPGPVARRIGVPTGRPSGCTRSPANWAVCRSSCGTTRACRNWCCGPCGTTWRSWTTTAALPAGPAAAAHGDRGLRRRRRSAGAGRPDAGVGAAHAGRGRLPHAAGRPLLPLRPRRRGLRPAGGHPARRGSVGRLRGPVPLGPGGTGPGVLRPPGRRGPAAVRCAGRHAGCPRSTGWTRHRVPWTRRSAGRPARPAVHSCA